MPGDLNLKKSWNPALVKNQKKVWEKEQEALKELKAIKERSKEIEREREKEEMIRLQYGDDLDAIPQDKKIELSKLGWMYQAKPNKEAGKLNESGFREVEEDFLSKQTDIEQLVRSNVGAKKQRNKETTALDRINSIGKAPVSSSSLSDDPLLAIRQEQRRRKRDLGDRVEKSKDNHKRSRSNKGSSSSRKHREGNRSGSSENGYKHAEHGEKKRVDKIDRKIDSKEPMKVIDY
ncbi:hypothetical_protein [Candidozyma auris]|uniref:U2-type spliceosomal complex subunit CWC25 n=1 Tax=Candidozyma auris TaxID=498019 RepID=UPI000D2A3DAF|nr:U2-type spliceosomal complex subunit CWC25 [[Candida] auris]QEO20827.1 hypothetical_protein [[Candida] auris]GBL48654.1 hypothetical protein CAJCM15448_09280 [[Candida] auris]